MSGAHLNIFSLVFLPLGAFQNFKDNQTFHGTKKQSKIENKFRNVLNSVFLILQTSVNGSMLIKFKLR